MDQSQRMATGHKDGDMENIDFMVCLYSFHVFLPNNINNV